MTSNMQNYININKRWDLSPCLKYEGGVDYNGMFRGIKFSNGFEFGTIDISNAVGSLVLFENCTFANSKCLSIYIKVYCENTNMWKRHITLFKNCDLRSCGSVKIIVTACSGMKLFDNVRLPISDGNKICLDYRSSDMRLQKRDCRCLVKDSNFSGEWMFELSKYAGSDVNGVQCENMFDNCMFSSGFKFSGSMGNEGQFINVSRMFNKCDFGLNTSICSNLSGGGKMLCMDEYPFLYKCTLEKCPISLCSGLNVDSTSTEVVEKAFGWLTSGSKKASAVRNMLDSGVSIEDSLKNLENIQVYKESNTNHLNDTKDIIELTKRLLTVKENGIAKYTVGEAVDIIIRVGFTKADVALGVIEFIKNDYLEE